MQKQLDDLKQQLKGVVSEYESRIQGERRLNFNLDMDYQATLKEKNQHVMALEEEVRQLRDVIEIHEDNQRFWAHSLVNRVQQVNEMLRDASHLLRREEGMMIPGSTPQEIHNFLEYCRDMIAKMREMTTNDD
ncbi:hypothetical protein Fmac_011921 [Flemingia macrophylla]|uniref:MADS-box protein n=1 Tax=Flemingia macrophylla TaxID=520843 RepID=A0ABD1MQX7_9FABA